MTDIPIRPQVKRHGQTIRVDISQLTSDEFNDWLTNLTEKELRFNFPLILGYAFASQKTIQDLEQKVKILAAEQIDGAQF